MRTSRLARFSTKHATPSQSSSLYPITPLQERQNNLSKEDKSVPNSTLTLQQRPASSSQAEGILSGRKVEIIDSSGQPSLAHGPQRDVHAALQTYSTAGISVYHPQNPQCAEAASRKNLGGSCAELDAVLKLQQDAQQPRAEGKSGPDALDCGTGLRQASPLTGTWHTSAADAKEEGLSCPVCSISLAGMDPPAQLHHTNACLDSSVSSGSTRPHCSPQQRADLCRCALCGQDLTALDMGARLRHVNACCDRVGSPPGHTARDTENIQPLDLSAASGLGVRGSAATRGGAGGGSSLKMTGSGASMARGAAVEAAQPGCLGGGVSDRNAESADASGRCAELAADGGHGAMLRPDFCCPRCSRDLSAHSFSQRVGHLKRCTGSPPRQKSRSPEKATPSGGSSSGRMPLRFERRSTAAASATCLTVASGREPAQTAIQAPAAKPIRFWLQGLGLSHHADRFEQEEVDMGCLPMLSSDDMRSLGITSAKELSTISAAVNAVAQQQHRAGSNASLTAAALPCEGQPAPAAPLGNKSSAAASSVDGGQAGAASAPKAELVDLTNSPEPGWRPCERQQGQMQAHMPSNPCSKQLVGNSLPNRKQLGGNTLPSKTCSKRRAGDINDAPVAKLPGSAGSEGRSGRQEKLARCNASEAGAGCHAATGQRENYGNGRPAEQPDPRLAPEAKCAMVAAVPVQRIQAGQPTGAFPAAPRAAVLMPAAALKPAAAKAPAVKRACKAAASALADSSYSRDTESSLLEDLFPSKPHSAALQDTGSSPQPRTVFAPSTLALPSNARLVDRSASLWYRTSSAPLKLDTSQAPLTVPLETRVAAHRAKSMVARADAACERGQTEVQGRPGVTDCGSAALVDGPRAGAQGSGSGRGVAGSSAAFGGRLKGGGPVTIKSVQLEALQTELRAAEETVAELKRLIQEAEGS